jgi:pilus assembly protein CpaB
MNKNRLIAGLALAVGVALLFSIYVYRSFQRASAVQPVAVQQIVVAAEPLMLGTRLAASDLQMISWPAGNPVPGMLTNIQAALGRALITPVVANEPILESKLAPREAGAGLPAVIPQGMRAVSVAVNDVVGVAGFVGPGTSVDVLVTGQIPGATQTGAQYVTRTILENVRVLAAGQKVEQDKQGKPQNVPVVTLLVTPQDADTLAMAATQGKIQLALRNTIDVSKTTPSTTPVLQAALFSAGVPVAQVKSDSRRSAQKRVVAPPTPPYTVEIIIGGKRDVKNFPSESKE